MRFYKTFHLTFGVTACRRISQNAQEMLASSVVLWSVTDKDSEPLTSNEIENGQPPDSDFDLGPGAPT